MQLEVKPNSRQVPKTKEYCSNKKYNDMIYSYLQVISQFDNEVDENRWFYKKDVNFSKMAEKFGLSRQTVSTRFKNLKELGLIVEKGKDTYELKTLENDLAALIPFGTLSLLVDALSDNAISVYSYLLMQYIKNGNKPFIFTLEQVKKQIGICATTRSNDNIITNILFVLEKIGLIKYRMTTMKQENDTFENVKTVYEIEWLTNEVLKIQSADC